MRAVVCEELGWGAPKKRVYVAIGKGVVEENLNRNN